MKVEVFVGERGFQIFELYFFPLGLGHTTTGDDDREICWSALSTMRHSASAIVEVVYVAVCVDVYAAGGRWEASLKAPINNQDYNRLHYI